MARTKVKGETNKESKEYVIDDANVLTKSQRVDLEALCKSASEEAGCDIVIITNYSYLDGSNLDKEVRKTLETNYGYDGTGSNCNACAYVVAKGSRADRIITSGVAKSNISQKNLDNIRISSEKLLKQGDYDQAFEKYVNNIKNAIAGTNYSPSLSERISEGMTFKLAISLGVAFIVITILIGNSKAKTTTNEMTYVKNHNFKVNQRFDQFIRTTVQTRHIERSSSSHGSSHSGGNSGSSGGHF